MKLPLFLTLDELLALHADQIARYGGRAGVRDLGLLKSALAMPQASFEGVFLHPTVHEMAAAYLFHLAQNHPFVDGNKRAALVAAIAFLGLNRLGLEAPDAGMVDLVVSVASGKASKAKVAVFLERHAAKST